MYAVIDIKTGKTIKTYAADKRKVGARFCDKKDLEYGAVRYVLRWIEVAA